MPVPGKQNDGDLKGGKERYRFRGRQVVSLNFVEETEVVASFTSGGTASNLGIEVR